MKGKTPSPQRPGNRSNYRSKPKLIKSSGPIAHTPHRFGGGSLAQPIHGISVGGPWHPVLKDLKQEKAGFHAFRRFRITHLRKAGVPESLIQFWVGHSPRSVTDVYARLGGDLEFRRECAERIGLGFQIPTEDCVESGSRIVVLDEMDESQEKEPVRN